ncbi:DMT family transporter [Gracilibacillus marinus]|uniref:DMT family transporter n=1 Tax=Gracilibacillus marinus TaxID=630535 RepID=A0ABV8VXV7_9BACI
MAWIVLIFAGVFEVLGVIGMNKIVNEKSVTSFVILGIGFSFSFGLLSVAMQSLPLGIAYAVWTGIGTVGSVLVGMIFYGEPKDWKRLLFIGMIISAVIGLKLTS